jgi:hypothetical protein
MTHSRSQFQTLPLLLLAMVPAARLPGAAVFQYLGDLPGAGEYSIAQGVSADGTYVVGESQSTASGTGTEAFVWDETRGMIGLGDLPGGLFMSTATAVTADGNTVVGSGEVFRPTGSADVRRSPFIWTRGGSMLAMGPTPASNREWWQATGMSRDGLSIIGLHTYTVSCGTIFTTLQVQGFTWTIGTPLGTLTLLPPTNQQSFAGAVNAAGTVAGAEMDGLEPAVLFRLPRGGARERLGMIDDLPTMPRGISADGRTIVGEYRARQFIDIFGCPSSFAFYGAFVWREGQDPPFKKLTELATPENGAVRAVGVSANGRTILDDSGGLYIDDMGPFDLRELLAEQNTPGLPDPSASLSATAISESGLVIVGYTIDDDGSPFGGPRRAWRVRLSDCDGNSVADELERIVFSEDTSRLIAEGRQRFLDSRETLGYGDMIGHYGRPWAPGQDRVPQANLDQPAEYLRALLRVDGCLDGDALSTQDAADRFLTGVAFPATQEVHAFEMLLGNEAQADAVDPTIGLDGIPPDDLGDRFAFKGASGIADLLDEELALLRGRELPGTPADWVKESIYYPSFSGLSGDTAEMAVYNRLPPNAVGINGAAYRSNYQVADNYEAAVKYPQGHGDAYGHYLSALRAGIDLLRSGVAGFPEDFLGSVVDIVVGTEAGGESVRQLAEAALARAQTVAQVCDLLHRRDYRENSEDPRALDLFVDPNPERAWSMGEWTRRGALGSYLDWAVVAHWAPTDEEGPVRRDSLAELEQTAGMVSRFQERLDAAGAGLDPLGLLQNVVPFGIDPSGLLPGSGRSHFEQVHDAAARAVANARKAFEVANQADQRLRESDRTFEDFADKVEDTAVDFDQQLIEIFGLPSPDDPQDNDLDPATEDFAESQSHPDLTNFLLTDEALTLAGFRPRQAPGQVQLALSEIAVAALRLEQAEGEIDIHAADIRSQAERIALVLNVQADRLEVNATACGEQLRVVDRAERLENRRRTFGVATSWTTGVLAASVNPAQLIAAIGEVTKHFLSSLGDDEFDLERERIRIQCQKEESLQLLEDEVSIDAERRQLFRLWIRTPQLIVDRSIQVQLVEQAVGRLQQAISRGQLLLESKRSLASRIEGQLLEERWRDLAFRVYRNAALKNYRALFDIAARYVVLTTRAYAYEFDARSDGEDVLAGIYRERRLGSESGIGGGLQGVLNRLVGAVTVNNFNRPLETLGERSFSFRRNLLGIGVENFPGDDLEFRAFLETSIVERIEDLAEISELAQVSVDRDYGPGIVIPFATEINSRNFFGRGPELPFGNSNFSLTRNAKIRNFAIRLDGVDASLGTDPESGTVFVYLLPAGDSVLRENTNKPRIEDELITPWAVVDQFLPVPPLASVTDFSRRAYNPWRSAAQSNGNFLNEIKRQRDSEAQVELGQPLRFNTNLAGRSAWNTRWLLVIPGGQWTSSSDTAVIRQKLLQFIYGSAADPSRNIGITDIRLIIQAYSH